MKVAVCGGAGYIGSHTIRELINNQHDIVIIDNLSEGHKQAIKGLKLEEADIGNTPVIKSIFHQYDIDAVMHFAASINVGESARNPAKYYQNNVTSTLNLLDAMRECEIDRFVFSSSCAIYGIPQTVPIDESFPHKPISPYGKTKAMVEAILEDYAAAYGLRYASLRYFNASGAMPDGSLGEDHQPETHLIPLVIQAALGQRDSITIFGNNYPTPDGTCIRDYIHVLDLASAHVKALEKLEKHSPLIFNLGIGSGHSVKEVIDTVKRVSKKDIRIEMGERRPGDPPSLVNNPQKVNRELDWQPRYKSLEKIVETAWKWHKNHQDGFEF